MQENSMFEEVNFHWLLINQSDFEANDEQIRVRRIESYGADYFFGNSIFIGFQLTNQVSHEIEVKFGFSMLDYLLSLVPGAKTCHSGSIRKSNELRGGC
jgi:hypothetical protein